MPTMVENPYFDPNPEWYFITVRVWFLISIATLAIGFYFIIFKSPKQSFTYRRKIIHHLIIGMIFELEYTLLSPSLIYFPYLAAESRGIWTEIGISPDIQLSLLINVIVVTVAGVTPLFYYRMGVLLPDGHALNKKFFRYFVYVIVYGFCYLALFPLLMLAVNYESQNSWKEKLIEEYGIHYDNFWNPTVFVVILHTNPWAELLIGLIVIDFIFVIEIIFGCCYVIHHTLQTHAAKLSTRTEQDHKSILLSLLALTLVQWSLVFVLTPALFYFIYFGSPRADIGNVIIAMAGGIYPASIVAYFMSYKPYRQHLIRLFKKKVASRRESIIAFTNVKLDQLQLKRRQTLY